MAIDRAAGRVVEPGGERELVAEVAREADELDARVALVERAHQLEAPVGAAVVHEHHLGRPVEGLEHGNEPPVELLQRLALVEDRDHERVLGRRTAFGVGTGGVPLTPPPDRPRG